MSMTMSIVEWAFVAGVALMALFPFLSYYSKAKTFKGMLLDCGHAYYTVFVLNLKARPLDMFATLALLFCFGTALPKFGYALAIYFFIVTFCISRFLQWHEQNTPVTIDQ